MANLAGGRRKARHESVEALLAAHPGETDPRALICRLAREKVAYAKSQGWNGPPFCPRIFASIFGLRCKEVSHEINGEGRILPRPGGGLLIEYRSGRLPERQRFTIFHEFAHTLFPDFCEFLPLHDGIQDDLSDLERQFEFLCDSAAAEMLLPVEDFRKDLAGLNSIEFQAIHHLRERYKASIDATTHRLVELTDSVPCAAVFLTDQKGSHPGPGPLWVKYCWRSPPFKGFLRPGGAPPATSVAVRSFRERIETTERVRETWWLHGRPRTWLVQAAKLPEVHDNPDYPKVVTLLLPSGYGRNQGASP